MELSQILPFGLIVILLFAFALDPDRGDPRRGGTRALLDGGPAGQADGDRPGVRDRGRTTPGTGSGSPGSTAGRSSSGRRGRSRGARWRSRSSLGNGGRGALRRRGARDRSRRPHRAGRDHRAGGHRYLYGVLLRRAAGPRDVAALVPAPGARTGHARRPPGRSKTASRGHRAMRGPGWRCSGSSLCSYTGIGVAGVRTTAGRRHCRTGIELLDPAEGLAALGGRRRSSRCASRLRPRAQGRRGSGSSTSTSDSVARVLAFFVTASRRCCGWCRGPGQRLGPARRRVGRGRRHVHRPHARRSVRCGAGRSWGTWWAWDAAPHHHRDPLLPVPRVPRVRRTGATPGAGQAVRDRRADRVRRRADRALLGHVVADAAPERHRVQRERREITGSMAFTLVFAVAAFTLLYAYLVIDALRVAELEEGSKSASAARDRRARAPRRGSRW